MHVSQISLTDFRSYAHLELDLSPGASAFVGPNGQGKTNLVEAIAYAATLASHRVSSETALVRAGSPRAVVRVRAVRGDRQTLVELEINPGRANRAQVNRSPVRRTRDVLGILRTVVFAPEDLAVVKGDPDGRRRFLDELTIQVSPRMAGVLADYDRVLRQRGALLKSAGPGTRRHVRGAAARGGAGRGSVVGAVGDVRDVPAADGAESAESAELSTLDVWDAKLAQIGAEVLAARVRLVEQLRPHVALAYSQVSDGGMATLGYRSSLHRRSTEDPSPWPSAPAEGGSDELTELPHSGVGQDVLEAQLVEALGRARREELERGVNLVGPHRDDLVLGLGGLPAKGYASHGESWSLALALRLASYQLLTHGDDDAIGGWAAGSEPVLVLDDVFAELDSERRGRLARLVGEAEQVLVTAAVLQDVPDELLGVRYDVIGGTVSRGR